MIKNTVIRVATAALLSISYLACDASDDDASADTDEAATKRNELPADVAYSDPWLARLDHSWIGPVDHGFVVAGYDEHHNVIGKISVYQIADNMIAVTHEYSRACDESFPNDGAEDCSDVLHVTVDLAEGWSEPWSNAPAGLFSDRAAAIAGKLPPETEESRFRCTLTLAAAAAACGSIAVAGVLGAPGCAKLAIDAYCECGVFETQFPKVDWSEVCGD